MGELRVMDMRQGDFRVKWNKDDPESLENARKQFDDLIRDEARRFRAYRVSGKGKRTGEPISAFDPDAEELVMVPQMAGG